MCCQVSLSEDVARGMPIPKQHGRMRQSRGTWGGEAGSNPSNLLCPPPIAATSARPLSQGLLCQSRARCEAIFAPRAPSDAVACPLVELPVEGESLGHGRAQGLLVPQPGGASRVALRAGAEERWPAEP